MVFIRTEWQLWGLSNRVLNLKVTVLQPLVRAAELWTRLCGEEPVAEAELAQYHSALWGRREEAGDHTWFLLEEDPGAERNTWSNGGKKGKRRRRQIHGKGEDNDNGTQGEHIKGSRNERLKEKGCTYALEQRFTRWSLGNLRGSLREFEGFLNK